MIQRIQSVYLLLAAVLMFVTAFSPLMSLTTGNEVFSFLPQGARSLVNSGIYQSWGVLVFALLAGILPLAAIFLYNRRPLQMKMAIVSIIVIILFYLTTGIYYCSFLSNYNLEFLNIGYGIILPFIALVLNTLAYTNIKKDEKLVKSLNRIR